MKRNAHIHGSVCFHIAISVSMPILANHFELRYGVCRNGWIYLRCRRRERCILRWKSRLWLQWVAKWGWGGGGGGGRRRRRWRRKRLWRARGLRWWWIWKWWLWRGSRGQWARKDKEPITKYASGREWRCTADSRTSAIARGRKGRSWR